MAKTKKVLWNKPIFKSDTCTITRHVKGQLDVFFGEGWENWARIILLKDTSTSKKKLKQLAGHKLSEDMINYLEGAL